MQIDADTIAGIHAERYMRNAGLQYDVIARNHYHTDLGEYHTYGIQADDYVLYDISVCKEKVLWMAELFNFYKLSPIHLQDAVENMLP